VTYASSRYAPMTGTAKHHPSLVKKAVVAYETGDTDRHVGTDPMRWRSSCLAG
jgi:hypothetical protein